MSEEKLHPHTRQNSYRGSFSHDQSDGELMGPLLRRKKVLSVPLGVGGEFFFTEDHAVGPHRQLLAAERYHSRQRSVPGPSQGVAANNQGFFGTSISPPESPIPSRRHHHGGRQDSGAAEAFFKGVVRRRQVSLDLLGPNDFFEPAPSMDDVEHLPTTDEDQELDVVEENEAPAIKIFAPLRFKERRTPRVGGSGGHGHGGGHGDGGLQAPASGAMEKVGEEVSNSLSILGKKNALMKEQLDKLQRMLSDSDAMDQASKAELLQVSKNIVSTHTALTTEEQALKAKLDPSFLSPQSNLVDGATDGETSGEEEPSIPVDDGIIRAGRSDKIKAAVCFVVMLALTLTMTLWHTHLDEESFIFGPIGLACVTDCYGDLETKDFFYGHYHFQEGEVIELKMHIDQSTHSDELHLEVEIVGQESGLVKATSKFETHHERRISVEDSIVVHFENPEEPHVINVKSSDADFQLSFELKATVLAPLAANSEVAAAVIMVLVYVFILLEVIHRTLVAIFGSMIALLFFFIMHHGEVESIRQLMLHLEWSTLGLLFGMMVIVGELSHTGIFEWFAVRVLFRSKGSYTRLMVLLCTLTAFASAFLDNVTTMLLVAPVTIDMCNILDVDPRPYLIGEVLLSNVGGTATLIGDPPNIIIGSSFDEIGFVDFIVHILPAIFVLCVPVSLALVSYIYRFYFTTHKMKELDNEKLRTTYPIYDEPRLLIAGTVTFFVILMFFLHPVHHKDTAWVALLGGFITMSFTNPHDVQDALRNHVEWDTLLFFAGLFVLVEVCAAMGLLSAIGNALASLIEQQEEENQLTIAITLLLWVSAITSAFLDNIPYTATMIPVIKILADTLPDTLDLEILAWALSFGACLGGNGTLLGASANIVTAGISTNKGFEISFLNFFYPGMLTMIATVGIANLYMLIRYVWAV